MADTPQDDRASGDPDDNPTPGGSHRADERAQRSSAQNTPASTGAEADRSPDPEDGSDKRAWHTTDEKPARKRGGILRETVIIVVCVLLLTWLIQTFVGRQYVIPSESMEPTLHGCTGCTNDRIVIDKFSYRFGNDPKPGDVVVFKAPTSSWDTDWHSPRSSNTFVRGLQDALSWFGFAPPDENDLVKRVIAVGGQTVACRNAEGRGVTVNGKVLHEPYIDTTLQQRNFGALDSTGTDGPISSPCYGPDFGPITIPKNNVWVMGDNRGNSADSRYHMTDEYQGTVPVSDIRGKVRFIIYPFSRWGSVKSVNPQSSSTASHS